MFYKLEYTGSFWPEYAEATDWEAISCPLNDGHQRAGKRIKDLMIELPSPKVPHFMKTMLSDWIISEEVAQLFSAAGFSGYKLRPVTVVKVRSGSKKDIPPLWEFVVTGSAGEAHPKSGIRLKNRCDACNHEIYTAFGNGLFIDESKWDGSDFFTVWPLPKFIIVTERVKRFILRHNLENCKLVSTDELVGKGEQGELTPR